MRIFLVIVCGLVIIAVAALAGMIAFGTRAAPPPLASISKPFESVDFSDLPAIERLATQHGSDIAFRHWQPDTPGEPERVVIAIHGSSASSSSLHPLAKALRAAGLTVYAPDIRGHGQTGRRGDIDYAGQLDDDLADFASAVRARYPNAQLLLTGFSSGGGFALHAAGSPLGKMFARVVLLSPMLGVRAPTVKPGGDAWAAPYIPRIIALILLNRIGIHAFDHLTTLAFAIQPARSDILTGTYSFLLMRAFATADYVADLRQASAPIAVVVGADDELFNAKLFAPAIAAVRGDIAVTIVPGLNHIGLTTDARAVAPIVAALRGGSS